MEWLFASIDPSRGHEISFALSWHARAMVLAWGVIVPAAIFAAQYLKVMPGQDWPRELDNQTWWRCHWMGQVLAYLLSLLGLGLILGGGSGEAAPLHRWLGYSVLTLATLQVLLGAFRGTKGGPTARARDGSLRGDHYDMTRFRLLFEQLHRIAGYTALCLGGATILTGLWSANAPRWMWLALLVYWGGLGGAVAYAQARGWAVDTYQAIWGPDPDLPGNRIAKSGWWTVRPQERQGTPAHKDRFASKEEGADVRRS